MSGTEGSAGRSAMLYPRVFEFDRMRGMVRDRIASLLYRSGLTRPARTGAGRLHVVTFHRVLAPDELAVYPLREIAVSTEEFRSLCRFFVAHYTCGPLGGIHGRWASGEAQERPFLAITFDDGSLDNYRHARPILEDAGLRATFFVATEAVGTGVLLWHDQLAYALQHLLRGSRARVAEALARLGPLDASEGRTLLLWAMERAKRLPLQQRVQLVVEAQRGAAAPAPSWEGLMDWEQLRTLARGGHEVGSHSASHPILTLLDDQALEVEVAGSKQRLEAQLGVPCGSFCYPNGTCDARVTEAVRRARYPLAVTTRWGSNEPRGNALLLSRRDMQGSKVLDSAGCFSVPRAAFRMSSLIREPRS